MRKKIIGIALTTLLVCGSSEALQLQPPINLRGYVVPYSNIVNGSRIDGFMVKNATRNNVAISGNLTKRNKTITYYLKGFAQFGDGNEAIYAHYDIYHDKQNVYLGGSDYKDTFPIWFCTAGEDPDIYRITTNENITMYMIYSGADLPDAASYYLLAKRQDGKWVKYIDTDAIIRDYFGISDRSKTVGPAFGKPQIQGDTIIFQYATHRGKGYFAKAGEFRFKWDDVAQWFRVEHFIY